MVERARGNVLFMKRAPPARIAGTVIVGVGSLALILRLFLITDLTSNPESDEIGYLSDGLLLLEGLAPGYKHVPSATITWLVALYAGLQTGVAWLFGTADPSIPPLLKPLAAMERVLFGNYADFGSLRLLIVGLQTAVGSLAAAGIAWLGNRLAGWRGALAGGLLAAALPLFVEYAAQTRSYSFAWSLALLSFVGVFAAANQWKAIAGAVFIGLAIATRVEMALCLPVLLLEVAATEPRGRRLRAAAIFLGIAIVCFCLAAPWYLTSLAGNLRQILDVRFLVIADAKTGPAEVMRSLVWSGLGLPLLVTILALAIGGAARRTWRYVAYAAWLVILTTMSLRQSAGGVRHDGALFVLVVATVPLAVSVLSGSSWKPRFVQLMASVVVCLVGVMAVGVGAHAIWQYRNDAVHGDPVRWLEANVPAGTAVYLSDSFAVPLPTEQSSEALWTEAARPDAWRTKFARAAQRLGLERGRQPRAMSEDPMQLERASRRRWFILGAPLAGGRPRYDIRLVGVGSVFGLSIDAVVDRLCKEGGAYISHGAPVDRLGSPKMVWRSAGRNRLAVYFVEAGKSCRS
jgi:hypothetical protein